MRYVEVTPGAVDVCEGPPAALGEGLARVRVRACGICGSDAHLVRGMRLPRGVTYPVRPGHEVAGEVLEVGPGAHGLTPGLEVVLHLLDPCGHCRQCLAGHEQQCRDARVLGLHTAGGMADEVVWPAHRIVPAPGLDPAAAALLPDAVATAYHAVRLAELPARGRLCVLGAGGVGTHVLELARVLHPHLQVAAVVRSEESAHRLEPMGVLAVRGLQGAAERVRGEIGRCDAVVDFSGAASGPAEAVRMLDVGGQLVLGSVVDEPIDLGTTITGITTRSLKVLGCYTSTLEDLRESVALAVAGRLDLTGTVSRRLPLAEAAAAFRMLDERPPGLVRLVLEP
ncbi:MAG: alcohol dehydrogenase catalytic domain-containing protein [Candidatus Dormibacteraeota bacterium]|nr:alcohol dehydrogenase catalytic domain-containing protein [Candidatus Dormibacteraeota bacterium]MBO0762664.1 alcohol dehydrogenase catalytic domain-containing protein [Candidatus Dormibacteraeota bacterium]